MTLVSKLSYIAEPEHGLKGSAVGFTVEGAPGFRAAYGPRFYVGYLRDPQGNKIALFSSNPDEPGRDD